MYARGEQRLPTSFHSLPGLFHRMTDTGTAQSSSVRMIGGRYQYDPADVLGAGGLATVYRGRDIRLRRPVAIKMLRDAYRHDPDSRYRFRQEARMMRFTDHPNLVHVYDLIEQSDESWIVMEYVPGRNLKDLVERNGPQAPAEVVRMLEVVSGALAHMHGRGIVHLDVKPQNIILTEDHELKLIDFGLAQPVGPRQETVGGSAFGTAAYLSPEQAMGGPVDARTDVYALGCVAYELLTGRPPFDAPEGPQQKQELIDLHLHATPAPPTDLRPGLPEWADAVVLRAIAKDPGERYPDVRAFAGAAVDAFDNEPRFDATATAALPRRAPERRITIGRRSRLQHDPAIENAADEAVPDAGPSPLGRAWTVGGQAARRSRRFARTIWRLALLFAIGNLILGSVLMVRDGPEALVERFLSVAPGTDTAVAVESLNLRDGPGSGFEVIALLPQGTRVDVTGLSESNDEGRWWPVELDIDGSRREGWVWEGGLQPSAWTGRLSFMQDVVDRAQGIGDGIANGIDTIQGWWPL